MRRIFYVLFLLSGGCFASQNNVDVARYAQTEVSDGNIILRWEEPRNICKVMVERADANGLSAAKLQYWQKNWPKKRVAKNEVVGSGSSGWMEDDDWYNGRWKNADVKTLLHNNKIEYSFNPVNANEFPDINDFAAEYRRTLKIRLLFEGEKPQIKKVEAYSDSVWKETEITIEWGDGFTAGPWEGKLSAYNGEISAIEPSNPNVKIEDKNLIKCDGKTGSVKVKLRFADNDDINSYDKTIITFRTGARSFSFLVNDVEAGEKVFVKDYDVLVTKAADKVSYAEFRKQWESGHPETLYDRISELPEQTFEKAWAAMPKKNRRTRQGNCPHWTAHRSYIESRGYMPLGCNGGRQKFCVDEMGNIHCEKHLLRIEGRDTKRVPWKGNIIRYSFGFPHVDATERLIEDGYLPIIHNRWDANGIIYEQSAFATLLGADILSGQPTQGDDPVILLTKVTLTNSDNQLKTVKLKLKSKCDIKEKLDINDGIVFATNYEKPQMRYCLDTKEKGSLKSENGNLSYEVELAKNESHSIYFKIPFITLTDEKEYQTAKDTDYENEFTKVKKFWQDKVAAGTQIITPNQVFNDFYKAHLTHIFITDDREIGSDRYVSRVGTFAYDFFPDESGMCISDLDRRGYKKEAEERLEMLIHYQGTVGLPGMYSTKDGQFYGAGGYQAGGYNKSHGWALWVLAEHYWYSRDKEWLSRIAPNIVKGCDWIINERQATKKFDAENKKVIEYGFLPPGSLEDVRDFGYWFATNAPTYWGFKNAAKALADINHPESKRLLAEAELYGQDLKAGIREAMVRSPVVKLRDGTYVPHFPPRLYQRGRGFGWLREVLEGAIHLIRSEMFEPNSLEADWIIKDHEDNLYISDGYGYKVENFERDWFGLGGFSMQSNLLPHPIPYLWRDEPKHFLRGFFNAFASVYYPDICALVEHVYPTLEEDNTVWFKPSDEAQSTYWLRLMFIYEKGNELNLGMAIPREWLGDGQSLKIERAMTYFGPMSYQISSEAAKGKITMVLEPPTRNAPENINVRFRHPEEKPIKKVLVNGKDWTNFDAGKELIRLGKITEKTQIVTEY